MKSSIVTLVRDERRQTPENLDALRREGLFPQDAPALMGENPHLTPLGLYLKKRGLATEKPRSESQRQLADLRAYCARRFCEQTGLQVRSSHAIVASRKAPHLRTRPGFLVSGGRAGLTCRVVSPFWAREMETADPPRRFLWMAVHNMAVTGKPLWHLAVLAPGKLFRVWRIDRDEAEIERLLAAENRFWKDHVLAATPPLPQGGDDENLQVLWPRDRGTCVDLTCMEGLMERREQLRELCERAREETDWIDQTVKAAMGEAVAAVAGPWRISWKSFSRVGIDAARLRHERPEWAADYEKISRVRAFRVTRGDGQEASR